MLARTILPTVACALLVTSLAGSAEEKKAPEDPSEIKVLLRLNAIETSKLFETYETLVSRELSLQGNVRACIKSGDLRLPEYQQALQEAQDDLVATKIKLVALEAEKTKLTARLGKQGSPEIVSELLDKTNQTLEKILERLNSIDKRLEKMDRQR